MTQSARLHRGAMSVQSRRVESCWYFASVKLPSNGREPKDIPMQANNVQTSASYVVSVVVEGYTWFVASERGTDGRYMLTNDLNEAKRYASKNVGMFTSRAYKGQVIDISESLYRVNRERSIDRYIMMKRPDTRRGVAVIFYQHISDYTCFDGIGAGYVVEFTTADPYTDDILDRVDGLGNNYADAYEFMCKRFPNRVMFNPDTLKDFDSSEWDISNEWETRDDIPAHRNGIDHYSYPDTEYGSYVK